MPTKDKERIVVSMVRLGMKNGRGKEHIHTSGKFAFSPPEVQTSSWRILLGTKMAVTAIIAEDAVFAAVCRGARHFPRVLPQQLIIFVV